MHPSPPLTRYEQLRVNCLTEIARCHLALDEPAEAQFSFERGIGYLTDLSHRLPDVEKLVVDLKTLLEEATAHGHEESFQVAQP